jgi:hypothetical protein
VDPLAPDTPANFNDRLIFAEIEASFQAGVLDYYDRAMVDAAFCQVAAEGMKVDVINLACRARLVPGRSSVYRLQASPADEIGRAKVAASLVKPVLYKDTLHNAFVLACIIKAGFAPEVHKVTIHDAASLGIIIPPTTYRAPVVPTPAPKTEEPTGTPITPMPTTPMPTKMPTTPSPTVPPTKAAPTPEPTKTFAFNSFATCVGSCVSKMTKGACEPDQSVRWGRDCNNLLKGPCRVMCGASSLLSARETTQLEAVFGFDQEEEREVAQVARRTSRGI